MRDGVPLHAVCCNPSRAADEIRSIWDRGEAVLPLNPNAPGPELDRVIAVATPRFLHDGESVTELGSAQPVPVGTAAVVPSSGTTGPPKLVELTTNGLTASAEAVSATLGARGDDVWLCCVPVHFVAGLAIIARSWWTGTGLVVHDRFSLDEVARAPQNSGATIVSLVSTMLARLLSAGMPPSGFRQVLIGGGPLAARLGEEAQRAGVQLSRTYGMTETWGGVVHDGHALDGVDVDLAVDGEIRIRAPMMIRGYRNDPGLTAKVLSSDGWLITGDLGQLNAEGSLEVIERKGDLINSGGVKVSPAEVEEVLCSHRLVKDLCIAGVPDDEFGERVVAYVVPSGASPPELSELRRYASEFLSREKLPREIVLIDEVPRSTSGKVLRRELRGLS